MAPISQHLPVDDRLRSDDEWQLFNVQNDIWKTTDLAASEATRVKELAGLWALWNAEQAPSLRHKRKKDGSPFSDP